MVASSVLMVLGVAKSARDEVSLRARIDTLEARVHILEAGDPVTQLLNQRLTKVENVVWTYDLPKMSERISSCESVPMALDVRISSIEKLARDSERCLFFRKICPYP